MIHQLLLKSLSVYNKIDSEFSSLYKINISELFCTNIFCAVEIVKKQQFPTIFGKFFVTCTVDPGKDGLYYDAVMPVHLVLNTSTAFCSVSC